jgi:AcrR family transcriptional regulator
VPKLWDETIDAHRQAVREATLAAAARLVAEQGLRGVTMSGVAEEAGIGRATLYKYFPDVDAILAAWHERQLEAHLGQLTEIRNDERGVEARLNAVLHAYAWMRRHSGGPGDAELAARLHNGERLGAAERQVHDLVRDLIADAAGDGVVRRDVSPDELAAFCTNALAAVSHLPSRAAVGRLVGLVLDGLRASS